MRFQYKSFYVIHEQGAVPITQKIISEHKPELIIELGTGWGGFTLILGDSYKESVVHSYDIPENSRQPKNPMATHGNRYVFHNVDILTKPHPQLVELCKDKRKKLLYCDNGDKPKEVRTYGIHLNPGDMLGVHDWGRVIGFEDIKDILVDFDPIEEDMFEKNGWMSRFWIRR